MLRETDDGPDDSGGSNQGGTTRRAALRTASVGLAAVVGTGVANAREPCVSRDELLELRDSYVDPDLIFEAVAGQQEMLMAVEEAGLFESEPLATNVTASAVGCEAEPRIHALRQPADGGLLTAAVAPHQGESYALHHTADGELVDVYSSNGEYCFLGCAPPCCSCEAVICYEDPDFYGPPCPYSVSGDDADADDVNCIPYCWECQCPDDPWDCIEDIEVDPVTVDMPDEWWVETTPGDPVP